MEAQKAHWFRGQIILKPYGTKIFLSLLIFPIFSGKELKKQPGVCVYISTGQLEG